MNLGTTRTFTPVYTPAEASVKGVTWEVVDESIASIETGTDNDKLILKANALGSTKVMATAKDGGYIASFKLTVVASGAEGLPEDEVADEPSKTSEEAVTTPSTTPSSSVVKPGSSNTTKTKKKSMKLSKLKVKSISLKAVVISGKTVKKAKIRITIFGKSFSTKADKKGNFTLKIKFSKLLKKKYRKAKSAKASVKASKTGYKTKTKKLKIK